MIQKLFFLAACFLLPAFRTPAQQHRLYELETELQQGRKSALTETGRFLDSKKQLTEFLGYHVLKVTEDQVAERILRENCMFLPNELAFDSLFTRDKFSRFLLENEKQIVFSPLADAFIITPFEQRNTAFEIQELSRSQIDTLEAQRERLLRPEWVRENGIDKLIAQHDPEALKQIAGCFLRGRYRFNRSQWNEKEHISLLELLTHTLIAVPDRTGNLNHHLAEDFYSESKINLLIFFARNAPNYVWDEKQNCFVLTGVEVKPKPAERILFELLSSKNDSIAMDAFRQLAEGDPARVIPLANEYEHITSVSGYNYVLPTFPYRFLMQLPLLTDYCKSNGISYTCDTLLVKQLKRLRYYLSVSEQLRIENEVINQLTPETITALEFYGLAYEKSFPLTYSLGRIMDVFYSRNWDKITSDPKHLALYLKKAALYNELGIIGSCNLLLTKFEQSPETVLQRVRNLQTSDPDILKQITEIEKLQRKQPKTISKADKTWDGNSKKSVKNIAEKLAAVAASGKDSSYRDYDMQEVLSAISYRQIPEALKAAEPYKFKYDWRKYDFLATDFGICGYVLTKPEGRQEFLADYHRMSEAGMYRNCLKRCGVNVFTGDSVLNYDAVYDVLKYDVVIAFVGGGGGVRDEHVYAVIKLLELEFKTTHGFPDKLCNSEGIYSCDCSERADVWMNYLRKNKLLKLPHEEPVSFRAGAK